MKGAQCPRAAAARTLHAVLQEGRSLSQAWPPMQASLTGQDKAFAQAISYQVLRQLPVYEWLAGQLLAKPLKKKVRLVHYVILAGLCQLRDMQTPAHAAVTETVSACHKLGHEPLKGLVNGVLRNYQRQAEALEQTLATEPDRLTAHPRWLRQRLATAWPGQLADIMAANNTPAPMWLRVDQRQYKGAEYQALLAAEGIEAIQDRQLPQAIRLTSPTDVRALPGFATGAITVQDRSAQWAGQLLAPTGQERVLDACAAPGGKTTHLGEIAPEARLEALELAPERIPRLQENLARADVNAYVMQGDASRKDWWHGELYDRILLDVPCSATGVIRRHPDIKWLRQDADIAAIVKLQRAILLNQWSLLRPGGRLVYATCSVLPAENQEQIDWFLAQQNDAEPDSGGAGRQPEGWQLLPEQQGGDGFFYACLKKTS